MKLSEIVKFISESIKSSQKKDKSYLSFFRDIEFSKNHIKVRFKILEQLKCLPEKTFFSYDQCNPSKLATSEEKERVLTIIVNAICDSGYLQMSHCLNISMKTIPKIKPNPEPLHLDNFMSGHKGTDQHLLLCTIRDRLKEEDLVIDIDPNLIEVSDLVNSNENEIPKLQMQSLD